MNQTHTCIKKPCKLHDDKFCSKCEDGRPIDNYLNYKKKTTVLWEQVKYEQESYKRIQKQIKELQIVLHNSRIAIQNKISEIEEIHEEWNKNNTEHLNT